MTNMAVSKQIKLFQSHGSQNSRTKASNYQVPFDKMCLPNVNFHKIFFPGTNKKFSCPEHQELVSTFYMFPENATMDVSAAEELVIAIDDEVGVACLFQSFSSISF